jgi:hypothetical protein
MRTTLYISILQRVPDSTSNVYGQPKTSLEPTQKGYRPKTRFDRIDPFAGNGRNGR